MIQQPLLAICVLLLCMAVVTQAMHSPIKTSSSSPVAAPVFGTDKVFGVSAKKIPSTRSRTTCSSIHSLRGGAVHEPETLADVEALLIKAGSEGKLVVIDFSATWCGPCKMIAPLFEQLSESFTNVIFIKVDVDANPDTAAKYSVSAMPTFLFIKRGEVLDKLMGASPEQLESLIREHQ
ncbi:hypothetical protein MPSEU_000579500 [Mayamaea pseudoterrestris]|nr:hypothetical protein MPSEU_000579500 [Mayamaea pseudoterrestris]